MEKIKEIPIGSKNWDKHGQTVSLPKSWAKDVKLNKVDGDSIDVFREGDRLILVPKKNHKVEVTREGNPDQFEFLAEILGAKDIDKLESIEIGHLCFSFKYTK